MSNQSLRKSWPIVYGFPIILIVMTLAVLGSRSRHLFADQICLISILAVGGFLYLRKPWAVVISLTFALLSLEFDPAALQDGSLSRLLRYAAELRFPHPHVVDPRDFVDDLDQVVYNKKIDQEVRLYYYFIANGFVFVALLAALKVIESRRRGKSVEAPELKISE